MNPLSIIELVVMVGIVAGAAWLGGDVEKAHLNAEFDKERAAIRAEVDAQRGRADRAEALANGKDQEVLNAQSTAAKQRATDAAAMADSLARLHQRLSDLTASVGTGAAAVPVSKGESCAAAVTRLADGVGKLAGAGGLLAATYDACSDQRRACERWADIVEEQVKASR